MVILGKRLPAGMAQSGYFPKRSPRSGVRKLDPIGIEGAQAGQVSGAHLIPSVLVVTR